MKYRKLRTAWSVAWGVVAVLLVVLWVRSFVWMDRCYVPLTNPKAFLIQSWDGEIWCGRATFISSIFDTHWSVSGTKVDRSISSPDLRPFFGKVHGLLGLDYVNYQFYQGIGGDHFTLVVIAAAIAALPWFRWPYRFSLRTLLIATTLIAVGLGMVVWLR